MKTKELVCANCACDFAIPLREWTRQTKKGRTRFFCSRSCAITKGNQEKPRLGNPENWGDKRYVKTVDDYSPMRALLAKIRQRSRYKHLEMTLTLESLKAVWDNQNGICPLTGWQLVLPRDTGAPRGHPMPNTASIDRIDNNRWYVDSNIRIVSFQANVARSTFDDECLLAFCQSVCGLPPMTFTLPSDMYANFTLTKRADKYSPFRKFLNSIKKRSKPYDVGLEDLKQVWDAQCGICPITGWPLILKPRSGLAGCVQPNTASIDRIDSALGYVRGNIRFIAYMANIAKSDFTDEDLLVFCETIMQYQNSKQDNTMVSNTGPLIIESQVLSDVG